MNTGKKTKELNSYALLGGCGIAAVALLSIRQFFDPDSSVYFVLSAFGAVFLVIFLGALLVAIPWIAAILGARYAKWRRKNVD